MPNQDPKTGLNIAVLTVSDTRTPETDRSGGYLVEAAKADGHNICAHLICADDKYQIRAHLSQWIADSEIHVVLVTGGTGFADRDVTPEAASVLFDKPIDGFGETFRALSLQEIGNSTIQSRCVAGIANRTAVFCLPGSTGACKTGWQGIIADQLNANHKPCNFVHNLTKREA